MSYQQVRFVVKFILFFTILNIIAVYIFLPTWCEQFIMRTELVNGIGRFTLTSQELFYLFNLILKYISTVPLALTIRSTTNPSHFAASLNQLGVNYKISYAVSLALGIFQIFKKHILIFHKRKQEDMIIRKAKFTSR